MLRQNRLRSDETELVGEYLYNLILKNQIGDAIHDLLFKGVEQSFLRVELDFADPKSRLIDLPWEYLFRRDPNTGRGYFLAKEARLALVRRPRLDFRALRVRGDSCGNKLRVLLVACSPSDLPELAFGTLLDSLAKLNELAVTSLITPYVDSPSFALSDKGKAEATFENLKDKLRETQPHVVHFLGHGDCERGGGRIAFVHEGYQADWQKGEDLAKELKECLSVRLAFLQACETAIGDPAILCYRAFSSVAGDLVQTMIPAIVAMQAAVKNAAANTFAEDFYSAVLKERQPLYRAMQTARLKSGEMACIPVLYLGQDKEGENEAAILMDPIDIDAAGTGVKPLSPGVAINQITCPWCGVVRKLKVATAKPKKCSVCTSPLYCLHCEKEFQTEITEDQDSYFCDECETSSYRAGKEPRSKPTASSGDGFDAPDQPPRLHPPAGSARAAFGPFQ